MKILFCVLAAALAVGCASRPQTGDEQSAFVRIENGRLVRNGVSYYYVGTNFWYGAILASQGTGGNRERLARELDTLKSIGISNLRILVGADGENGVRSRVEPTLQTAPGVYNDTILDGLDYLMAELGKRDMLAVLYLNNSWEWSGGYSVYLQWAGHGKAPVPSIDGWPTYMDYVRQFQQSDSAKALFANHVRFIVSRTNRYTGLPYTDDPAIMAWQIGNEPRAFADENKQAFAQWIGATADLIKSLDHNHLVSTGSEGRHGCEQDMALCEQIHAFDNVDYINFHIWPYNWGWAKSDSLEQNLERAKANTRAYIDDHRAVARRLGKPMVLEEFGFPRDGFQFATTSATTARDSYYDFVFQLVENDARNGGELAGCNFWAWGGLARPASDHIYWERGDDYTGDPAQEEQGLNSVFVSDSTVGIIARACDRLIAK